MRVATIFVSMLAAATPADASDSCMTKAEVRRHFGSVHIFWHGPNSCWDATPTRRLQIQRIQRRDDQQVQRQNDQPQWRQARSEMFRNNEAVQTHMARMFLDARFYDGDATAADANWLDRWVDILQVAPIPVAKGGFVPIIASPKIRYEDEPIGVLHGVVLVFLGIVLTIAVIGAATAFAKLVPQQGQRKQSLVPSAMGIFIGQRTLGICTATEIRGKYAPVH